MVPDFLLPANEAVRLHTLQQYKASSLLSEPIFDELVRLTARVFNLPISLISIVEAEETIYIANAGLPSLERQPRLEAICALAVRDNKAIVFADLMQLADVGLTREALEAAQRKNLQFYAGVPLRVLDEVSIGALCVIDHQPRLFSAEETRVLEQISDVIAQVLEVRHYCLTLGLGETHWQTLQDELVTRVWALTTLLSHSATRLGTHIPVSPQILVIVMKRLQSLHLVLQEYLKSKG